MHMQWVVLLSDWFVYLLLAMLILVVKKIRRQPELRTQWRPVFARPVSMSAAILLSFFILIASLDSVHFQVAHYDAQQRVQQVQLHSALDMLFGKVATATEKTYSAPLARTLFVKSLYDLPDGREVRDYAPLKYAGQHMMSQSGSFDIMMRVILGCLLGGAASALCIGLFTSFLACRNKRSYQEIWRRYWVNQSGIASKAAIMTLTVICMVIASLWLMALNYHVLGTNQVGQDIFYESIKSVRTGIVIGTLTTLFMLPFALLFGTMAGYFGGWVDDIIQYLYTTLSSIPGVLLISAVILVLQVYISQHEALFPTLLQRADARLLALCLVLGLSSWAGLCRLLRGETLKLREQEYVLAARSLGVSPFRIIWRHIMPNVMHIILITVVLDFSGLVLAEAVLSYVGVGVDPTTMSWGNLINGARLELARDPVVWWPLVSALIFMFLLVLSANFFSDAVRDAFDPKLRGEVSL